MHHLSTATAAAPDSEKSSEGETKTQAISSADVRNPEGNPELDQRSGQSGAVLGAEHGARQAGSVRQRRSIWQSAWWDVLGVLGLALMAAAPWSQAGLWDPVEVRAADLARRAASHLFGGASLNVTGTLDPIPTVEEVGRGEMPVLVTALALRVFGNHAWTVRLPLLIWAFVALGALFFACRRLASRESAWIAGAVLATSPAFFLQARTGLGDIASMACVAAGFVGFHLAWADERLSSRTRVVALGLALAACVGGYFSRGAWLGVAVPALGSGLVWLLLGRPTQGRVAQIAALAALVAGAVGLALGLEPFLLGQGLVSTAGPAAAVPDYSYALGSAIAAPKKLLTHDTTLAQLGHSLFPWSALLPATLSAALGATLYRETEARKHSLTFGLVLVGALGLLAQGLLAPRLGVMPFVPLFAFAGVTGLGFEAVRQRRASGLLLALSGVALLVLLLGDFVNEPVKAWSAFGLDPSLLSGVVVPRAKLYFRICAGIGIGALALLALEHVEWVGKWVERGLQFCGFSRARVVYLPLVVASLVLSWGYYPALARQLSPVGVYDAYHRNSAGKEPLGVVGKAAAQGSVFYAEAPLVAFDTPKAAVDWLGEGNERRWLIVKRKDLASTNSFYRARFRHGNLPIIDAESSEILLASNRPPPAGVNKGPFSETVLDAVPALKHPLSARFGANELAVLGWAIFDENGVEVERLVRGRPHDFRIYYSVLKRPAGQWKTFVHLDGTATFADKRINGDHDTTPDYPMREWQEGDVVVDSFRMQPDTGYPAGSYGVYFGLFSGNQRLQVTGGPEKDNRVVGGTLVLE